MAEPTIDATVGGASSNAYVALAFADAYFADTLEAAEWQDLPREDRARALISATRKIDEEFAYHGVPYDTVTPQALKFPRSDDFTAQGELEVPDGIEYATCELALALLRQQRVGDLVDRERLQEEGVRSVSVDGLTEEYRPGVWDGFPRRVKRLLRPFVDAGGRTAV
jgi:Putative DnaT-like ssDNA binding protein